MDSNDPKLKSFIFVSKDSHFPIQNLPLGVFKTKSGDHYCGVAIGEEILNLTLLEEAGLLSLPAKVFHLEIKNLNRFIGLGRKYWRSLRKQVSVLLRDDNSKLQSKENRDKFFVKQSDVEMRLPVEIGDYTDFYSSIEHASNVGAMFRDPKNPLLPNWKHLPVGYHGRSSSVVVSGTPICRPNGQIMKPDATLPEFSLCKRLDFELESAFIVGKDSNLGSSVSVDNAEEHVFGIVLMNDWSARDIQKWEYVPLGPFVSKSFATSVSPWVVSLDALEPFRALSPKQDPKPLPYLNETQAKSSINCSLEVKLKTANGDCETICRTNMKHLYWSIAQQLAHHTITGCNVRVGDLMASGTISGSEPGSYGSLLELSWGATKPLRVGSSKRCFLEDGDSVIISGHCLGEGYNIGFGQLVGTIKPGQK